jgi:hypothetical protein
MSEIPRINVIYRIQNVDSRLYLERGATSVPQMRPEDATSKRQHVRHYYSVSKQNSNVHVHSVEDH